MKLLKLCGINVEPEFSDELGALEMMVDTAGEFLLAGGVLSFGEWCEFGELEKEAFQIANNKLDSVRAVKFANANKSDIGEALVYADIDGGHLAKDMILNAAVDNCAKGLRT